MSALIHDFNNRDLQMIWEALVAGSGSGGSGGTGGASETTLAALLAAVMSTTRADLQNTIDKYLQVGGEVVTGVNARTDTNGTASAAHLNDKGHVWTNPVAKNTSRFDDFVLDLTTILPIPGDRQELHLDGYGRLLVLDEVNGFFFGELTDFTPNLTSLKSLIHTATHDTDDNYQATNNSSKLVLVCNNQGQLQIAGSSFEDDQNFIGNESPKNKLNVGGRLTDVDSAKENDFHADNIYNGLGSNESAMSHYNKAGSLLTFDRAAAKNHNNIAKNLGCTVAAFSVSSADIATNVNTWLNNNPNLRVRSVDSVVSNVSGGVYFYDVLIHFSF